jgi:hypothetical protein
MNLTQHNQSTIFKVPCNTQTYKVDRVIDSDTLLLTNGEKVRLIGIDAPESRPNPRAEKQAQMEGKDLRTIISMWEKATKFVQGLGMFLRFQKPVFYKD